MQILKEKNANLNYIAGLCLVLLVCRPFCGLLSECLEIGHLTAFNFINWWTNPFAICHGVRRFGEAALLPGLPCQKVMSLNSQKVLWPLTISSGFSLDWCLLLVFFCSLQLGEDSAQYWSISENHLEMCLLNNDVLPKYERVQLFLPWGHLHFCRSITQVCLHVCTS